MGEAILFYVQEIAPPLILLAALGHALLALPSAIASRLSSRAGLIAWLITLGLLVFAVGYNGFWRTQYDQDLRGVNLLSWAAEYTLFAIVPQALAYPVACNRPIMRIAVASGLGAAAMLAGLLAGAHPVEIQLL